MSVVSAQHAHTPTGPSEHGNERAQEAVASAPARDANATHGKGHAYGHFKDHGNGHAYGHTKDHGKPDKTQPAGQPTVQPGEPVKAEPLQQDIPAGDGDTRVDLQNRVEIARQAWDKFNFPTVDRGLLI